ncbi:MAG: hypothetical protein WCV50_03440 [Patescibacteria group bacterium]|jgi:hypothetical protein
MIFGFSTGDLHDYMEPKQAIAEFKKIGCRAVELGFVRKERIEAGELAAITEEDLAGFDYVSLHAPRMDYADNQETFKIFQAISETHKLRPLDVVVIHPDNVIDIDIFDDLPFPVGFENMDKAKNFGKKPEDLSKLLTLNTLFRFILDVNHIWDNDPTMKLAADFIKEFSERLSEIHISGLDSENVHYPLFKTRQTEIIKAAKGLDVPFICESGLAPQELALEKDYIEKEFNSL